jgi:Domain of unknown function (DUF5004)
MKFLKFNALVLFSAAILGLSGCAKEDVSPNSKIVGTWKITSGTYKDTSGSLDFWTLYNAFYPCTKEITMSFTEDGKYSVSEPKGCVDDDGLSLFIFSKTGTFVLTDNTSLDIVEDDATPYKGKVVFADGKFTWTYDEVFQGQLTSLIMVFTQVK